jgi:hypothetical protein
MRIAVVVAFLFLSRIVLGDQPAPIRPDPKLTPGATFDVTLTDISAPGYSKKVRHVTAEMRREVFREYGIGHYNPGDYEVDHLIPLSLGGSNSIKNLWPESYRTTLNAHVKDRLEDRLHALVVRGSVDLKTAQKEISEDWIVVSDHFKPASNYRNDPATPVRVSRHFCSKQARCKLLLSGSFETKMPLSSKHLT